MDSKRVRSFEFAVGKDGEKMYPEAKLPVYMTKYSAGADFFCAEEVEVQSIWAKFLTRLIPGTWMMERCDLKVTQEKVTKLFEPTRVHTGIKANMLEDEVLELYNRSSNPKKRGLILANSVGVIDADYYSNEDNDGEIVFMFYNFLPFDITIKVGDRVGQGVFKKILRPEVGLVVNEDERSGGFGSTDN